MTLSEINELGEGMHVDRVEALMAAVFERESKVDKKNRPYTLQNAYLTEGGEKIKVSFWNHPDLTKYRGNNVIIRSKPPKSFITVGKYKDQTQLSVPGQAVVLGEGEVEDGVPMEFNKDGEPVEPSAPKNPPKANVAQKRPTLDEALHELHNRKPDPKKDIQEVRQRVMQYANLREICDHAASFLYQEQQTGMVEIGIIEKIKDVSSCFFIQGIRDGLHLKLPNNKPLSKKEDVEASEPEMMEKDTEF